jgi:hypothetical protein
MNDLLQIIFVSLIFLILGIFIGQSRKDKQIKRLELNNRILKEALVSERKKVETLGNFKRLRGMSNENE